MQWDASADDLILGGAGRVVVPDGQLVLGSTAVTSTAAELNLVDGITAGTVIASKAIITDSNIDITGGRNATFTGVVTGLTLEATGDTAAGDNAAIGYTSAEGLILTGQGSTNDITIKNDADADVITIATGTTVVGIPGSMDIEGAIDVNGTTNLDVVDIDGAVNMATTALVTGVLTTTAATVFNGGFASNANSTFSSSLTHAVNAGVAKFSNSSTGQPAAIYLEAIADNGGAGNKGAIYFDAGADGSVANNSLSFNADHQSNVTPDMTITPSGVSVAGTALVTGVLTTTAATVFNGGFASNAASTITVTDTSDVLSLVSTDAGAASGPGLELYRNSSSGASGDGAGKISFTAEDANSDKIRLAAIFSVMTDATNGSEDGSIYFTSMTAGTERDKFHIYPTETVFNEDSIDQDFRVESDTLTHALFVQGSDGNVGIGTGSPTAPLHINSSSHPQVKFGGSNALYYWGLDREASAGDFSFVNANGGSETERVRILAGGGITFNGDTAAANALDDYEEGNWTPAVSSASAHATQVGRYTKIGRMVSIQCLIQFTQSGTTFGAISGIPFAPVDLGRVNFTFREWYTTGFTYSGNLTQGSTTTTNMFRSYDNTSTATNGGTYGFAMGVTYIV